MKQVDEINASDNDYLVMYQAIFCGKQVTGDCIIPFGKKLQRDNIDELREIISKDIHGKELLSENQVVKVIFTAIFQL